MLTTDLAFRMDPAYEKISRRFYEHPDQFADAFAKAWFKLTHRDMGPISLYLGPLVPAEPQILARPVPAADHKLIGEQDYGGSGGEDSVHPGLSDLPISFDRLGGGVYFPRLRQAWRGQWSPDSPRTAEGLGGEPTRRNWSKVLGRGWKAIQKEFNSSQSNGSKGKKVWLADLIVLGGCAAVERSSEESGPRREGSFLRRVRTDASLRTN